MNSLYKMKRKKIGMQYIQRQTTLHSPGRHDKLHSGQWELGPTLQPRTFRIQDWFITATTELLVWYHVLDISLPTVSLFCFTWYIITQKHVIHFKTLTWFLDLTWRNWPQTHLTQNITLYYSYIIITGLFNDDVSSLASDARVGQ
jgi:hypothetical protein